MHNSSLAGKAIFVSDGTHNVRHTSSEVTFAAYVRGFSRGDCTYAFPAGVAVKMIYEVGIGISIVILD